MIKVKKGLILVWLVGCFSGGLTLTNDPRDSDRTGACKGSVNTSSAIASILTSNESG